jgi:hypothetical protein
MSDLIVALKQTYDSYGDCATTLFELQVWLLGEAAHGH